MKPTPAELQKILADHVLWLRGDAAGKRADLRSADLSGADLSSANLRSADLSGADLRSADLSSANLSSANLSGANLSSADLSSANLSSANLSADLRGANQKSPVPSIAGLHQKMLAAIEGGGTLDMGSWHGAGHACETTHCRAGWVVHLAGDVGRALEYCLSTPVAAALIELASEPTLEGKVPNYYTNNETALADIKRIAAIQAERAAVVAQ